MCGGGGGLIGALVKPVAKLLMGSPPKPSIPPAPSRTDPSVQAAGQKEKNRVRANAAGRGGTILTGGRGVTGTAPVEKKTLLGS